MTKMYLERLKQFDPTLLDCIEAGAKVYQEAVLCLAQTGGADYSDRRLDQWARQKGVAPGKALDLLLSGHLLVTSSDEAVESSDEAVDLKASIVAAKTSKIQETLIRRLRRDFLFGLTDMLRLRTSPALGYLRLQLETLALIQIMESDPNAAALWLEAFENEEGRAFHDRYQPQIVKYLRQWELYEEYSRTSGTSQHSRVLGVAAGVLTAMAEEPGQLGLAYQEIDDFVALLSEFRYFLAVNREVLRRLLEILPKASSANGPVEALQAYEQLLEPVSKKIYLAFRRSRMAE